MAQISLESKSIRISLTPEEVSRLGFPLNQPHFLTKRYVAGGGMELVYSSAYLGSGPSSRHTVSMWIPPLVISPESGARSEASIKRPVADATFSLTDPPDLGLVDRFFDSVKESENPKDP